MSIIHPLGTMNVCPIDFWLFSSSSMEIDRTTEDIQQLPQATGCVALLMMSKWNFMCKRSRVPLTGMIKLQKHFSITMNKKKMLKQKFVLTGLRDLGFCIFYTCKAPVLIVLILQSQFIFSWFKSVVFVFAQNQAPTYLLWQRWLCSICLETTHAQNQQSNGTDKR